MRLTQAAILLAIIPAVAGCATAPITPESVAQWNAYIASQQGVQYVPPPPPMNMPAQPALQQPGGDATVAYCRNMGGYVVACKDLTN